jgi:hypothetical protein
MRLATLSAAAAFVVLAPDAFAQTPKGYTGAYAPAAPIPYSAGQLREVDSGPGLNITAPDGSIKTVKAVPCTPYARETDGTTTCIGIPDPVGRGDSREGTIVGKSRR